MIWFVNHQVSSVVPRPASPPVVVEFLSLRTTAKARRGLLLLLVSAIAGVLRAAGGTTEVTARRPEGATALLASARAKHVSKIDGTPDILEVAEVEVPWPRLPGRISASRCRISLG
jgi:hypothetical protein